MVRRAVLAGAVMVWVLGAGVEPAGATAGWSDPQPLSDPAGAGEGPQVAMSAGGAATAAWEQVGPDGALVVASSRPAGGDWAAAVTVSETAASTGDVRVAMDRAGAAVVVWQQQGRVLASRRPAHGTWTTPVTLSGAGQPASFPEVAVDGRGDVTVVWQKLVGTHDRVQVRDRAAGGTWGPVRTLSGTFGDASRPQLSRSFAGDTIVVWERDWADGGRSAALVVRRPHGGTWTRPRVLSHAGRPGVGPLVGLSRRGDAVVTWGSTIAGRGVVQARVRPVAGPWGPVTTLSGPASVSSPADLAVNSGGDAVVAWHRGETSGTRVQTALRRAGQAWETPVTLSPASTESLHPSVALSADGTASAVWANDEVQGARRPPSGPWAAPVPLSDGVEGADAQVATDPGGDTVVVWKHFDGTTDRVVVSSRSG